MAADCIRKAELRSALAEQPQQLGEVFGQLGVKAQEFAGRRVDKADALRVQALTRNKSRRLLFEAGAVRAVDLVAHDRMSDARHVYANLVCASGFERET